MRLVILVAVVLAGACESAPHDVKDKMAVEQKPRAPRVGPKVYLSTPRGEVMVDVEVVATEATIERGLMFRQHLPPDDGMLFLMGAEKDWTFWMRNTLISLDMIFITKDLVVAGVSQNAVPRTETLRSVGAPSVYVLEVNGGWTAARGVIAGSKVRFDGVDLPKATPER